MTDQPDNAPAPKNDLLKAWERATLSTYEFEMNGERLTIRYQTIDILELLAVDVSNPLMAALQNSMGGQDLSMKGIIQKPEDLEKVVSMLNDMMTKSVVEPPLLEQGHQEGISLSRIPYTVKLEL